MCTHVLSILLRELQDRYLARHLKALLNNGIGSTLKKKRLQELIASIDDMGSLTL